MLASFIVDMWYAISYLSGGLVVGLVKSDSLEWKGECMLELKSALPKDL